VIDGINTHVMIIVTGAMNADILYENRDYERVMGKHRLWLRNDKGEELCEMGYLNELAITGMLLPHKTIHKAT